MRRPREPIDTSNVTFEFPEAPAPVDWTTLFGNDLPVELEIGSGKGLFLQNQGTLHPQLNFFGIEIAKKYAKKAAERIAKHGLTNVRVWTGDARLFLSRCTPSQSVRSVHVYFPDPWWKARHKKRRVFSRDLVIQVDRILYPQGYLKVATDVEEYYGVIRELVAEFPQFTELPLPEATEPSHELDYLTNFERKYRIEGRPIYRVEYQRNG